jgi:hypothetical protein
MKKLLILAAVGGALAAAAPAQAGGFSFSISNGNGGGVVFSNGQVQHYNNNYNRGGYNDGWHRTEHYHQARKMQQGWGHGGQGHGQGQGFNYIPKTVKLIQERTGGKVTDIVFRNGVYHVKGFGPRGRFNEAKADPYTGRLFDVRPANPNEVPHHRVIGIRKLLAGLRQEGFSRFDRVDLKGHVYKVRGLNKRGKAKLITVDSRNGYIQHVRNANRYNLANNVKPERKPFKHWRSNLNKHNYSNFHGAQYVQGGSDWTDHYQVRGKHGKRNVDLRICAYTGSVLGYRYL